MTNHDADDIFDNFMTNRVAQGALFADFVSMLNMKALAHANDESKVELLTEILNDVKLFLAVPENDMPH